LRPDIVLELEREGRHELHVFDAKLRVDGGPALEDENADRDPLTFKKDDVAKMHAYRDALPHVRSARVLYPGEVVRELQSLEPGATEIDVVGAVPLVPGKEPTDLMDVLARLLWGPDSAPRHDA